jgi:glutaredoxin-like protein NrdH
LKNRKFVPITATGKDQMMPTPRVMVFSLSTCSHCKSAKRFLDDREVEYTFLDVDLLTGEERKAAIETVKKLNPKCSFPTIKIGEKVVVGFKETEIREALES